MNFAKQLKGMQTYIRTPVSKSLIETIGEEMESPWMSCKYSGVKNPKTYSNSPGSPPRYYVSGVIDMACPSHVRFLEELERIRLSAKADGFLTLETKKRGDNRETTGNHLLKFQSKSPPAIYVLEKEKEEEIELEGEIPAGMLMKVTFEARRYMNKHTSMHSLTFPPSKILLLAADEATPHSVWDCPSDAIKKKSFHPPKNKPSKEQPTRETPKNLEPELAVPEKRKRGRPKKDPTLAKLSKPKDIKPPKPKADKKVVEPKPKSRKITADFATSVRSGLKDKKKEKKSEKKTADRDS